MWCRESDSSSAVFSCFFFQCFWQSKLYILV
jgi:hypothetical protein